MMNQWISYMHTQIHIKSYIYILYMHIYSGIFHDNSNSSSISKCHCALHVTGRGSQTLGASWFCRMLSSSCKDCARVSSRWAGGFNPQETHGKFRGNGNGRMNVFFPGKIWKYYHFHQMIFHIRYGNNQPWLIFLGSLFNSKWRSVKVFPGIERPTVRIPKTVLVVSSCWPSWFISIQGDILNNSWGLQTNKPNWGGVPPCSHGIILGIYVA